MLLVPANLRGLVAVVVVAAIGAAIGWSIKPAPAPGPAKVQVDTVEMEAERVDLVKPSLGQKVTTTAGKATQTRVADAPSAAGRQAVEIYCRPAIALQTSAPATSGSDTTGDIPGRTPPALLPDFQGRIRGSRVTLYSTLNDGRRWAADYRPKGNWAFETSGDSLNIRWDRWWVRAVRGARECAIAGAAGGLVGLVIAGQDGAAVGAATSCGASIAF